VDLCYGQKILTLERMHVNCRNSPFTHDPARSNYFICLRIYLLLFFLQSMLLHFGQRAVDFIIRGVQSCPQRLQ
jgi:hypothetical protein